MKFFQWHQFQIIAKTITLKRIWNYIKIVLSYRISLFIGKPVVWGMPYSITIEPTNHCNLSCPECPSGLRILQRDQGNIEISLAKKIIADVGKHLFHINFYFQGEPFLHPEINSLFAEAKKKAIYTVASTNGHFITTKNAEDTVRSGLSELIVSIDGTDQETYASYRKGGKLERVIESIQILSETKKQLKSITPIIHVQFLVTAKNEHQIDEIRRLCKEEIPADKLSLKTAQIYDFEQGNTLIPKTEKYSRYAKQADGRYTIKSKLKNQCSRLWTTTVICSDGSVVPCCFDKDGKYKIGNITNSKLEEIWKNRPYTLFREHILINRKGVDICCNCSEGLHS